MLLVNQASFAVNTPSADAHMTCKACQTLLYENHAIWHQTPKLDLYAGSYVHWQVWNVAMKQSRESWFELTLHISPCLLQSSVFVSLVFPKDGAVPTMAT